jgi:hypothetical protein
LTFTYVSSTNHRFAGRVSTEPGRVGQQRSEPLHPPVSGDMVDLDVAFDQQFLHVPIEQL